MEELNQDILLKVNQDLLTKYLTFEVADQHYGIRIGDVIEIVQIQPATEMPDLPYYAKGIINLRGRVIPLIDVNLRFGKEQKEYTDRTCIIIVDIDGVQVGLIVDAVSEVLNIDESIVCSPPPFSGDSSSQYVTGIGKLDNYMVLLLNCRLLLSDSAIGVMEKAAAG